MTPGGEPVDLVYSQTTSGLTIANQASDEASVRAALREHNRDLKLEWKRLDGRVCWYVTVYLGSARTDAWVCDWTDETGAPLPLSHGLVERVKQLDGNSRWTEPDPAVLNDRRSAELEQASNDEIDWYAAELVKQYRGRSGVILPRGLYRRKSEFKDIRR
jgi:hypothetical protein